MAVKIALLGAESTGKSTLAEQLHAHLNQAGLRTTLVKEVLRQWCERQARTPRQEEQASIAAEQAARIEAAAAQADCVIADTTPLMVAVYSEHVFLDHSLYQAALAYQKNFDLTLLTALDLPWVADGLQREGSHVQAPVDTLLRQALHTGGLAYQVVHGVGNKRTQNALQALSTIKSIANYLINTTASGKNDDLQRWKWQCEKCSEPSCEHQLFRKLLGQAK
jgi:nicotinamide riboside kinase